MPNRAADTIVLDTIVLDTVASCSRMAKSLCSTFGSEGVESIQDRTKGPRYPRDDLYAIVRKYVRQRNGRGFSLYTSLLPQFDDRPVADEGKGADVSAARCYTAAAMLHD